MFNHWEVSPDKTHEWLKVNTLNVIFSSYRQKKNLHCKYLLASDTHSRMCACTVFSFIAFHFWILKYVFFCFFFHSVTQWWLRCSMSSHFERFSYTLEKAGWKFAVHVERLYWNTLPQNTASHRHTRSVMLAIHTKTFFLGTKVKFLFSWNIDVVPCMCLEVELTM